MKTRVLSGIVVAVVCIIMLVFGGWVLWGALLVFSLIACIELAGCIGLTAKSKLCVALGLMATAGLYVSLKFTGSLGCYAVVSILLLTSLFFYYVFTFPKLHAKDVMGALFCFMYAPCMLSFIYLIREMPYGNYLAWVPFNAFICDTCALFAGRAFGKHKLAPILSPKKTVEGAVGGILGSVVAGTAFGVLVGVRTDNINMIWIFAIITFLESIVTQVGDLAASGLKRDHGIKDYGNLIPGHGGIMDRFDSVMMAAPIIYFLAVLMVKMV